MAIKGQDSYWLPSAKDMINHLGEKKTQCARLSNKKLFSNALNLISSLDNQGLYCGTLWPDQAGWQQAYLLNEDNNIIDRQWYYNYQNKHWQTWQQALKHNASSLVSNPASSEELVNTSMFQEKWLDKSIIWLIFFLGCAFLWIEKKLYKFH
jgi:hypothetical protein